ncbi:NCS2 family permease [uncultured Psychromonas sp.]|uniref:NCS2 family permease n=1 Tax=uncultured Psychromonas sp. TaxID=173974 RepID=UPI002601C9B6|nr:NCS2 family permease [uncultured Psychromonas sp.]
MLEKLFKLSANNSNVKTEIVAGFTTFLTMAYIIFVNPSMLSATGMDSGAVFVATCLAAAVGCFIMGLYANYPVALAPGMGLNAFFSYVVVLHMGYTWEVALGAVFLSGVCFTLLSLFKIREWIINSIPLPMRKGIAAGIGLFLALIALKNAGIVVANPATLVGLGDMTSLPAVLACVAFIATIALAHFRVKGGVMFAILGVTIIGLIVGDVQYTGIISMPPSIAPTFMQMDIAGAFNVGMVSVVFAFLFVDLFDTSGTLIAVADKAKLLDKDGNLPRLNRALLADSGASIAGSMLGTSTTTSYIESVAGVAEGGRTGLTAVVVGVLFLLALFFAPLAGMVPAYATAGALLYVAVLMVGGLKSINWEDITEAAPVVIIALMMPLTFSIANGISIGFIAYAAIKVASGKSKELTLSVWFLAILFLAKLIFFPG